MCNLHSSRSSRSSRSRSSSTEAITGRVQAELARWLALTSSAQRPTTTTTRGKKVAAAGLHCSSPDSASLSALHWQTTVSLSLSFLFILFRSGSEVVRRVWGCDSPPSTATTTTTTTTTIFLEASSCCSPAREFACDATRFSHLSLIANAGVRQTLSRVTIHQCALQRPALTSQSNDEQHQPNGCGFSE